MKIKNSDQEIKYWAESTILIAPKDARIVYDTNHYDGPLEGVLRWNNKQFYFHNYTPEDKSKYNNRRIYAVIEMTQEQEREEQYWQERLVREVGFVNEYDEDNNPIYRSAKSATEHERYWREYQKDAKEFTLTRDQIKARWFE